VKTDDLIETLVKDRRPASLPPRTAAISALVAGSLLAGLFFLFFLHPRADLAQAVGTYRVLFKWLFTLVLATSGFVLVLRVFRPESSPGRLLWLIALAPVMLLAAVLAELIVMPSSSWLPGMIGISPIFCFFAIYCLSIGPLLAFLAALRAGAPSNPGLAGALAGLVSSGVGAALFIIHCPNDSPLFLFVWYSLAIGLVTLTGYLAGRRWLSW
jgi:hypothetical protein